jgi:hypothetical protein
MAIQATGNEPMPVMTASAIKVRMPAGCRQHLLPHLKMTGKAFLPGRLDWIPQGGERFVRISMALQTILNLVMRPTCVAKGAGGYGIFSFRGVLRMAIEAADFRGVLATPAIDCLLL